MTRTSVIVSPAPSSVSMLGEQDQEMMGDRVPGDQMVPGRGMIQTRKEGIKVTKICMMPSPVMKIFPTFQDMLKVTVIMMKTKDRLL